MSQVNLVIFNFDKNSDISSWRTVDDNVMGGKSTGNFKLNEEGYGEFYGEVSLENNGGFSSLRHQFNTANVKGCTEVVIHLKGDGKNYQFRLKDDLDKRHSYIHQFKTSGAWQTIVIQLSEMYPAFRGNKLSIVNFSAKQVEEVAFLIGNKKEEQFKLEIDKIYLQ